VIAHHVRSGTIALNVVTAALDADPRTAGTPVFFANRRQQIVEAVSERAKGQPVLVAWSFFSVDASRAEADLAWLRSRLPADVLHVAGGVHATAEPAAVLAAGFDLVALGEGEATFAECVHAIGTERDPRAVAGTAHLCAGRLTLAPSRPRRALDDFPAFNFRFKKWNPIEITRGCIYACSFCQTPFAFKARFRHRSVENVREHVRHLAAHGGRYVRFISPTSLSYGADDAKPELEAIEALLAVVREELPAGGKIYFGSFPSEVRPEHVTPEALALLRRHVANDNLVIGGQSGSDRVLGASHRGHSVADVERAVRLCLEAGFRPDVDFLFGLPGETVEDQHASARFAEKLAGLGARIHNHSFMPLPGTPLSRKRPQPIDRAVLERMNQLESRGALYGQWRRQLVLAKDLVARARRRSAEAR
jgi:B12-binding domain/radical SAM domain protein